MLFMCILHNNISLFVLISSSQQSLPRQLNLPLHLALFEASPRRTYRNAIAELHFVFEIRKRARTVVREVDAGECVRTEVLVARDGEVVGAILVRVGGRVALLLVLMLVRIAAATAAEELLEQVCVCRVEECEEDG